MSMSEKSWNAIWDGANSKNWLDRLIARETALHEKCGTEWQKELFAEATKKYGRETIQEWERKFLLRFSVFPIVELRREVKFNWWKVKPSYWFYRYTQEEKIGYIILVIL